MLQLVFQEIGADGTQYAELSMMKKNPTSIRAVRMDQNSQSLKLKLLCTLKLTTEFNYRTKNTASAKQAD